MSFFCRLSRKHYWCTPHRSADNRLIQVCYECGAERPVRELHEDYSFEKLDNLLASNRQDSAKAYPRVAEEMPERTAAPERIAVGQQRARKFMLIK